MTSPPTDWRQALTGDVRANNAYQLRPLGDLSGGYRASLERLGVDITAVFGVLFADPQSGLPDKLVDERAADLFTTLGRPRRPPPEATDRLGELVLDQVLEIEGPTGFVTGPLAYDAFGSEQASLIGDDRLGHLSGAALDYAERLRLASVDGVTARLYAYHRVPLSRRWAREYPGPRAVLDLLPGRTLSRRWVASSGNGASAWLAWSARRGGFDEESDQQRPYKLYVSPRCDELPQVMAPLVEALTDARVLQFKIGADAAGLLRPDKCVVYLRDAHETAAVASALEAALAGATAHGVPFSADLAGDGLLSWGGDPPPAAAPIGRRAESWRFSVCRRLAEQLTSAQRVRLCRTRPADFALARLALDEVDTRSFAPAALERPSVVPTALVRLP